MESLKEKLKHFDWKKELKEWGIAFLFAVIIYYVVLPAILGTPVPATVVASCSEKGFLNIGDIVIVHGIKIKDLRAPQLNLEKLEPFKPIWKNDQVVGLNFSGKVVWVNKSNDIVVYFAYPSGFQIIHKALVKLNVSGKWFLITKGDANPVPDQYGEKGVCVTVNKGCISTYITDEMLAGKVIGFPIPLLGHVKLFFCDLIPICSGHSNPGTNFEYRLWC